MLFENIKVMEENEIWKTDRMGEMKLKMKF
jgi:hypothetical protein